MQKNVYKSILEKNAEVLKAIAEAKRKKAKKTVVTNLIGGGEKISKQMPIVANGHAVEPVASGNGVNGREALTNGREEASNGALERPVVANGDRR